MAAHQGANPWTSLHSSPGLGVLAMAIDIAHRGCGPDSMEDDDHCENSTAGSLDSFASSQEPAHERGEGGLEVQDREAARVEVLAKIGAIRLATQDIARRVMEVCRKYEEKFMAAVDANNELIRCGLRPRYRMPRPPLVDARIHACDGDMYYLMHTDLIQVADAARMAEVELSHRKSDEPYVPMPGELPPHAVRPHDVERTIRHALKQEMNINNDYYRAHK